MSKGTPKVDDAATQLVAQMAESIEGSGNESSKPDHKGVDLVPQVKASMPSSRKKLKRINESPVLIPTNQIIIWGYADRFKENATSDACDDLISSFRSGIDSGAKVEDLQLIPGVVRHNPDKNTNERYPYQLIAGRRRYNSCDYVTENDNFDLPFKALIKHVSDVEAAKIMFTENHARKDLKGFERAMSWARMLGYFDQEPLFESQKDLIQALNMDGGGETFKKGNVSKWLKCTKLVEHQSVMELLHGRLSNIPVKETCDLVDFLNDSEKNKLDVESVINDNKNKLLKMNVVKMLGYLLSKSKESVEGATKKETPKTLYSNSKDGVTTKLTNVSLNIDLNFTLIESLNDNEIIKRVSEKILDARKALKKEQE